MYENNRYAYIIISRELFPQDQQFRSTIFYADKIARPGPRPTRKTTCCVQCFSVEFPGEVPRDLDEADNKLIHSRSKIQLWCFLQQFQEIERPTANFPSSLEAHTLHQTVIQAHVEVTN